MSVPRARILELMKVQCEIFSATFNPHGIRAGNKILRQRLKGPSMSAYYPRRVATIKDLQQRMARKGIIVDDEEEDDRLEHIAEKKLRGKGGRKRKAPDPTKAAKKK